MTVCFTSLEAFLKIYNIGNILLVEMFVKSHFFDRKGLCDLYA